MGVFNRLAGLHERLRADDMMRHGLMMAFFMALANFGGYLYYLFLGIFLTAEEYGILFSLSSLFVIVTILSDNLFRTTIAKFTSKFKGENALGKVNYLWHYSIKRTLLLGVAFFALLTLLIPVISHFLHIENNWYAFTLIVPLPLVFALPVIWGTLQGLQSFLFLGLSNVLLAFIKLGLAILLVALGFGVFGGLVCVPIAYVVTFLVTLYLMRRLAAAGNERFQPSGLFRYAGLAFVAFFAFIAATHGDVVLAKHFLSADQAGNYSAISVLGRVVLYAPVGIAIAMFPKTSQLFEVKMSQRSVLLKATILTLIISGVIVLLYGLFPAGIIDLIFGDEYSSAIPSLFEYGLAMALFALSFLLMNYCLSINQTKIAYPLLGGLALECVLISLFHSDIGQIVNMVLISAILCFTATLAFYAKIRRSGPRYELGKP